MGALKVKHVVVMGHYGCVGVAESMKALDQPIPPTAVAVQSWIRPIREIYQTSTRFVAFLTLALIRGESQSSND